MPANTEPIYTKKGNLGTPINISAANTSSQGGGTIGTDIFLAFTADATNGSFVREVRFSPTATAPTTTTATVGRVFWSTQTSGATTTSNTHWLGEVTLSAVGADNASTPQPPAIVPIGFALPPGATILVTNHAAPAANSAWKAVVIGGDY